MGSATELEYHLILGNDIEAISQRDFESLLSQVIDVKKMLTGLLKRLDRPKPGLERTQKANSKTP